MRALVLPSILALAALAAPAAARDEPDRPITEQDVSARDVAATPATDLNLRRDEIPPLLIAAQERPYDVANLRRCPQIQAAVRDLDALLGDDVDLHPDGQGRTSAGRVAQSVVGSFIPFRGVIREISGANQQQRRFQAAIMAGVARRAFLKGVGDARGCRYPARSAPAQVVAARAGTERAANAPATRNPAVPTSSPGRSARRN